MDFEVFSNESSTAVLPEMENVYHPWCDSRIKSEVAVATASSGKDSESTMLPELQLMGL